MSVYQSATSLEGNLNSQDTKMPFSFPSHLLQSSLALSTAHNQNVRVAKIGVMCVSALGLLFKSDMTTVTAEYSTCQQQRPALNPQCWHDFLGCGASHLVLG